MSHSFRIYKCSHHRNKFFNLQSPISKIEFVFFTFWSKTYELITEMTFFVFGPTSNYPKKFFCVYETLCVLVVLAIVLTFDLFTVVRCNLFVFIN